MAKTITELTDGITSYVFIDGGKERWFKVKFNSKGKANFHISPNNKNVNVDLYVHTGASSSSKLLGSSTKGTGKDDTVYRITVASRIYYYMCVKNLSKEEVGVWVRAKNYPELYGKEADLQIQSITARDTLIAGEEVDFRVKVKNEGDCASDTYDVKGYCDGELFDTDSEKSLDVGDTEKSYIRNVVVNSAGEHNVKVKVKVGDSIVDTCSEKFTWDKTEAAKVAAGMPFNELFHISIRDDLSMDTSGVSKTVRLSAFQTVTYQSGVSDTSSKYNAYFNFSNGNCDGIIVGGVSYDLTKGALGEYPIFADLNKKVSRYFRKNGFSSLTVSSGAVTYEKNTHKLSFTKFQVEDSVNIGGGKKVYTRLVISEDFDMDRLAADLVVALAGLLILAAAPESLAIGGLAVAAALIVAIDF